MKDKSKGKKNYFLGGTGGKFRAGTGGRLLLGTGGGPAAVLPGTGGKDREGAEGGPLDWRVGGRPGGGPGGGSDGGESVETFLLSELLAGIGWVPMGLLGRRGGKDCGAG